EQPAHLAAQGGQELRRRDAAGAGEGAPGRRHRRAGPPPWSRRGRRGRGTAGAAATAARNGLRRGAGLSAQPAPGIARPGSPPAERTLAAGALLSTPAWYVRRPKPTENQSATVQRKTGASQCARNSPSSGAPCPLDASGLRA